MFEQENGRFLYPVFIDELVETETEFIIDDIRYVGAVRSQEIGNVVDGKIAVRVNFFLVKEANQLVFHFFSFFSQVLQVFFRERGKHGGKFRFGFDLRFDLFERNFFTRDHGCFQDMQGMCSRVIDIGFVESMNKEVEDEEYRGEVE